MKTKKTKRYSIISDSKFDDSHIENISHDEFFISSDNIEGNEEPAISKVTRRIAHYVFFFNVDLRKAINSELFNVRVSVRSKINRKKFDLFSTMGSNSPKTVISTVYGKMKDNKTYIVVGDRDGLLSRVNVSLLDHFDFFKLNKANQLNDRQLFGTTKKIEIVSVDDSRKAGKNYQLSQRNVTENSTGYINSSGFIENYQRSLSSARDPSSNLFPSISTSPVDPARGGCFVSPNVKSGNRRSDEIMFSLRKAVEGRAQTREVSTSLSQMSSGAVVGITKTVTNTVRRIPIKINIDLADLSNANEFFLEVAMIDKLGKMEQIITKKINHRQKMEDYLAPSEIISSKLSFSRASVRKIANVTLSNIDPYIFGYDIYIRRVSETQDFLKSKFRKITTFKPSSIQNKNKISISRRLRIPISGAKEKMVIMRAIPITKDGRTFNNFSSSLIGTKSFLVTKASVYTKPSLGGIILQIKNLSENVTGVFFERRNITRRERDFTPVITSVNDGKFLQRKQSASAQSPLRYSVEDENVTAGHQYEYRARLFLREGVSSISTISRFEVFNPPMNFISCKPISIDTSNNKVSFKIAWNIKQTTADKIKAALESAGLSDLWEEDLDSVKNNLRNLIFFDIERFNYDSGETDYLGVFPEGETVVDNGLLTAAGPPTSGISYIYRISPTLMAPEIAFDSLKSSTTFKSVLSDPGVLRSPTTYAKLRRIALQETVEDISIQASSISYNTSKANKYFSKPSLTRGVIPSSPSDPLREFFSGDYFDFDINLRGSPISLSLTSLTYSANRGPVLRLTVGSGSQSKRELIDSFVILCEKQGVKSICGACHKSDNNNLIFIDYLNKNYVGRIVYSAIPIFLDGETGKEISLGSTIMRDRQVTKLRGN